MTVLRLCFVGDSVTAGTGDEHYSGWPARLCAAEHAKGHDVTMYNLGIRGDTSVMIAKRWRAECQQRLPAEYPGGLIFSFGVNDAVEENGTRRVEPEETAQTARAILAEAAAWQPTLMIGPTPIDESKMPFTAAGVTRDLRNARVATMSRILEGIATEAGVPYFDAFTWLNEAPAWRRAMAAGDGAHPSAEGYAFLAASIGMWPHWRRWFDAR
jgi:lysophospholipase L1-like esterase